MNDLDLTIGTGVVLAIVILLWWLLRRRKRKPAQTPAQ